MPDHTASTELDVVVVGAGFAGLYQLHQLRQSGFSTVVLEAADGVGGTWYWNRYPGARCDIETLDYSYSFDADLDDEWEWSEKYATQPEILRYAEHVADRFDLKRDIVFETRVDAATWDDTASRWTVRTDVGHTYVCQYFVMATGCLSMPTVPDIAGIDSFAGPTYYTSRWPHEGVDFTGMNVGVIGTGSSGIQSIPLIAREASAMTVFQRTANFSVPAENGPLPEASAERAAGRKREYREEAKWSRGGVPGEPAAFGAFDISEEERLAKYEQAYAEGRLFSILGPVNDLIANPRSNATMADFLRDKIRGIVDDPETAETLCPTGYPFGTKRPCLDTDYFETFNLPHVRLVDLRATPITAITESGVETTDEAHEFDAIVFATGFDAMTGAVVNVDIRGRDGLSLADKWAHGPRTYLGLTSVGFPNLFLITGPGSPSVLSNMMVSIEQHVDWITDQLVMMRDRGLSAIEPTQTAEDGWVQHVNDFADLTLYPVANSWYMGANIPGKPRVFLPYVGGVGGYRQACDDIVNQGHLGFRLRGADGEQCNDGVLIRLQPDVTLLLDAMAELEIPDLSTLPIEMARAFYDASGEARPPGPEVGSIVDGTFPAADGSDLDYRAYTPTTAGPHPVIVYFHGGGWVLGNATADDPYCRDLCDRADAVVVSCDYRHAPEAVFPAAADDALAALNWVADNAQTLGGIPGRLSVAGWSAGGNLAAVAAQQARNTGGPALDSQLLINPVADADFSRPSLTDNAEGYFLTTDTMRWFWDLYCPEDQRSDAKASPLAADDLSGLPTAVVVTAEFDPLRDGGDAYAEALAAAGVDVVHLPARGQIHTSATSVDMVISATGLRSEIGSAMYRLARAEALTRAT